MRLSFPATLQSVDNLGVLYIGQSLYRGVRFSGAMTHEFKPVQEFRNSIHQTTDTDNDKCCGTHSHRIEQRNQPGQQNQYGNHIESSRHRHPATGGRKRGYLLHPSHHEDKPQQESQQICKEIGHNDEPCAKQQATHSLNRKTGTRPQAAQNNQ